MYEAVVYFMLILVLSVMSVSYFLDEDMYTGIFTAALALCAAYLAMKSFDWK
jgi:hypothetical protein